MQNGGIVKFFLVFGLTKLTIWGFLGLLIANLILFFIKTKWRIQNGGVVLFFLFSVQQNLLFGFFGVADCDYDICLKKKHNVGYKMEDDFHIFRFIK